MQASNRAGRLLVATKDRRWVKKRRIREMIDESRMLRRVKTRKRRRIEEDRRSKE